MNAEDILHEIFRVLRSANWTAGDLLHYLFYVETGEKEIQRSHTHAAYVQHYLTGKTKHHPSEILDAWLKSPDGHIPNYSQHQYNMYDLDVLYLEIKAMHPAITSFAVQVVRKKLVIEVNTAVGANGGLQVKTLGRSAEEKQVVKWDDISHLTVESVKQTIHTHQLLMYCLCYVIAMSKQMVKDGDSSL